MTARDLISFQADNVGYQLEQAFANLPESLRHERLVPSTSTPHEMIEHLAECYQAALEEAEGKSHDWGSFTLSAEDWDERMNLCRELRNKALEALLSDDESKLKACSSYIVTHDAYHVGQMAMLRVERDPKWDPYSIYR